MNTLKRFLSPVFFTAMALQVSGCATMNSTSDELQTVAENEGIIIGSIEIVVAEGNANDGWTKGRKAGELEYTLNVAQHGLNPFQETYTLPATPGKEAFFVKKLKSGRYEILNLQPTGWLAPTNLYFPLKLKFEVMPQQTSYIGKLVVQLPARIGYGSHFDFSVVNAMDYTLAQLRGDYPSLADKPVILLAGIGE